MTEVVVTVRCVAFNHARFIRRCLDGLLMQKTAFLYEIVVHDDASSDGTAEIVREYAQAYPDRIVAVLQKENVYSKGGFAAVIEAMSPYVHGRYTALCEGDDCWTDPGKLQRQVDFLESHPDYALCYTRSIKHFESRGSRQDIPFGGPAESFEAIAVRNPIPTATALVRSSAEQRYYAEIKPFERGWLMGDFPKWLWLSHEYKVKFFGEATAIYNATSSSVSHSTDLERLLRFQDSSFAILRFMESHFHLPEGSIANPMAHKQDRLYLMAACHAFKRFFSELLCGEVRGVNMHCILLLRYFLRPRKPADRI